MSDQNRIKYLETSWSNLRVIKRAHAFAMERKKRFRLWFGILSAALSMLVASGLIEVIFNTTGADPSRNALVVIKILTFLAAVLTSALTLLNYEKEAESHLNALEVYSNLARDCGELVARLNDGVVEAANIDAEIKVIDDAYDKANQDFKNNPPWNRDYDRARAQVVAKDAKALAGKSK
jgi:hypothetical protein